MSTPNPDITLYFLNSSRAIRIAWLLQELGLTYRLVRAERAPTGLAPEAFKNQNPNVLGKSPTITDGNLVVTESGAILEYICETYDSSNRFLPPKTDPSARAQVREWLHAAEGTFMVHAVAILYSRREMPDEGRNLVPALEERLSKNVKNDFNWLEGVLKEQRAKGRDWIVGEGLTLADIQMQYRYDWTGFSDLNLADRISIMLIYDLRIGVDPADKEYPEITAWLERTKSVGKYREAVDKTGFTMFT
jgi:glutathione S-transferase